MRSQIRPAVVCFLVLTAVTGIAYPAAVTVIARLAFPHEASGSIVTIGNKSVGSELIGQSFAEARYFCTRPSATTPMPYNAAAGAGSNLAPSNPALIDAVKTRIATLRAADPSNTAPVPADLVTASASGLDPHISIAAARYQLGRVARARQLTVEQVEGVLEKCTEARTLGVLGELRVNVLRLNLALDHPEMLAEHGHAQPPAGGVLYRWRGALPGRG